MEPVLYVSSVLKVLKFDVIKNAALILNELQVMIQVMVWFDSTVMIMEVMEMKDS